jgi:ubiquinone/menaquinone biosynthesis C-methylase UbiE
MARTPRGPSARFFDLWSRVYDLPAVQRAVYRPVQDAVVDRLRPLDAGQVLDLGCGTGILSARMVDELAVPVVGCDYSAGMLDEAAARTRRVAWVQGDALVLPLRGASVDVITSTEAFHWFPDPAGALAEIRRVLRPGGTLLVALVNPPAAAPARAAEVAARAAGQPARWPTRSEMAALVEGAGLRVVDQVRIRRIGSLVVPTVLTVAQR